MQVPYSENSGNPMRTKNKSKGPDISYMPGSKQMSAYDGAEKAFNALTKLDKGEATAPPLKPMFHQAG